MPLFYFMCEGQSLVFPSECVIARWQEWISYYESIWPQIIIQLKLYTWDNTITLQHTTLMTSHLIIVSVVLKCNTNIFLSGEVITQCADMIFMRYSIKLQRVSKRIPMPFSAGLISVLVYVYEVHNVTQWLSVYHHIHVPQSSKTS